MPPGTIIDWIVGGLGAVALIVGLLLPVNAGSTIYGSLFLIVAGAAAYLGIGTWHAPVLAAIGIAFWLGFLWSIRTKT